MKTHRTGFRNRADDALLSEILKCTFVELEARLTFAHERSAGGHSVETCGWSEKKREMSQNNDLAEAIRKAREVC